MPTDISARVRAKFPIDETWAELWEGSIRCGSCRRETRFVSSIKVHVGAQSCRFDLAELGEHGDLFETLCEPLIPYITACRIARRPSLARGRWCLSNGCMHCGAFIGEYEDFDAWTDERQVETFPLKLEAAWRQALLDNYEEHRRSRARKRRRVESGQA